MGNLSPARRCARVMLLGLAMALAQAAAAFPNAYVGDYSGNIDVIDLASNKIIATIGLNWSPPGLVVSPDGQWVYAVNSTASVDVIETFSNTVVRNIEVGSGPSAIVITPDGNWLYVANAGDNTVSVVDVSLGSTVATVPVGKRANAIALSPDGRRVYVVGSQSNNVTVIDTRTNAAVATFTVGNGASSIAVSPDSNSVWVTNLNDSTVYVVDTETNGLIGNISFVRYGQPVNVAFSPDGSNVYIVTDDLTASAITIVNPLTYAVSGQIGVPGFSHMGIALSPDGSTIYLVGQDTTALYAVSVAGQAVVATVNLPATPIAATTFVGGSAPPAQNFTLAATTNAGGSITSSPPGINCTTNNACSQSATYAPGTVVTLSASPSGQFGFAGWSGDCSGESTCTLTMNAAHTISAAFGQGAGSAYFLGLGSLNYPNAFLITSSPPGISCPPTCNALFPDNSTVALTTTLLPGFGEFSLQSAGYVCSNLTTPCMVTVNGQTGLGVSLYPANGTQTLGVSTIGSGTVSISPNGINCANCSPAFAVGTNINLTATPSPGYMFTGWSEPCTSATATCSLTLTQATDVTANFSPIFPQAGYWWNPAEPGRGYNIEQQGENIFMAAFLYDASGRATWWGGGPAPLTAGTFSSTLFAATGGPQLTGPYTPITGTLQSGPITLTFTSPTAGTASFGGNTIPIERFNFGPGGAATLGLPGTPETGWWWIATEPGCGFAIEVQETTMFVAGYMYDSSGNPIWYSSGPTMMTSSTSYSGTWTQFANGETLSGPWKAAQVANADAGNISIVFSSSNAGMLTFPDGRTVAITRFKF